MPAQYHQLRDQFYIFISQIDINVQYRNVLSKQIQKCQYLLVNILIIYFRICENFQRTATLNERVTDDQEGIINVFRVNYDGIYKVNYAIYIYIYCDQLPYCSSDVIQHLPQTTFQIYIQKKRWQLQSLQAFPQSLDQYGYKLISNDVIRINKQDEQKKFEKSDPKQNKIILFTKKMNIHNQERVKFGEVFETPDKQQVQKIMEQYQQQRSMNFNSMKQIKISQNQQMIKLLISMNQYLNVIFIHYFIKLYKLNQLQSIKLIVGILWQVQIFFLQNCSLQSQLSILDFKLTSNDYNLLGMQKIGRNQRNYQISLSKTSIIQREYGFMILLGNLLINSLLIINNQDYRILKILFEREFRRRKIKKEGI